ncbi:MAG TPA: Fic family protein [Stellaceae bacterium]|nr:Fic family protein [Stellaceae bacterium]
MAAGTSRHRTQSLRVGRDRRTPFSAGYWSSRKRIGPSAQHVRLSRGRHRRTCCRIARRIARAHAFEQGNKRTAFAAMRLFLRANGYDTSFDDEVLWADETIALVEHRITEEDFVSAFGRSWSSDKLFASQSSNGLFAEKPLRRRRHAASVCAMIRRSAFCCARVAARFWYRRYITAA